MKNGPRALQPPAATALIATLEVLAIVVWTGGLVVLGAIVAPTVFRIVPAPTSADAMLVVFGRFDRVAIGCAAVTLACEAALQRSSRSVARSDIARIGLLGAGAALRMVEGLHFSPTIAALHQSGVVRGVGAAGADLERAHRWAESLAKTELLLLVIAILLLVLRLTLARPDNAALKGM